MKYRAIADRYAKALFSIGENDLKQLDEFNLALQGLDQAVMTCENLDTVVKNPVISIHEKREVFAGVIEIIKTQYELSSQAAVIVKNFCNILITKNRLNLISEISISFGAMLDKAKGIVRGTLCSAIEINKNEKENILKKLEEISKCKLALKHVVDPSILGGIKLSLGDKVLDASLQTQLNILSDIIKKGE